MPSDSGAASGAATEPAAPAGESGAGKPPEASTSGTPQTSGASGGDYTVAEGDTLSAIASEHGLNASDLAKWNSIENPNQIRPGQTLKLSGS
jgi:lipoprotein NlpD